MNLQANGWLAGIDRTPSPNCDERPDPEDIDLLVIHSISLPPGVFGGDEVEAFFQNRLDPEAHPYFQEIAKLQVSSHLFIRRNGHAQQFVPFHRRAWHAGLSCFDGREKCNDYSIGIELEGTDDASFTAAQYRTLADLTAKIRALYPAITADRIIGHSDIAPGRKTDPGPGFNWERYRNLLS